MLIKESIRSFLESANEWAGGTGPAVMFPCLNRTVWPVVRSARRAGYSVTFMQRADGDYDHQYVDVGSGGFKKFFEGLVAIYLKWIKKREVEYFVVDRLDKTNLCYLACLRAAQDAGLTTVYLEHGHSGCYHPNVVAGWLLNFDYVYCQDNSMRNYLIWGLQKVESISRIRGWRERTLKPWKGGKTILYAPTLMSHPDRFERLTPETLRWGVKKQVLKTLSLFQKAHPEYRIVYKYHKGGSDQVDPAPNLILDRYQNIDVSSTGDLIKAMRRAALFITDAVSTPLYHAAEMGVPSLCLVYERGVQVREDIKKLWKHFLLPVAEERHWVGNLDYYLCSAAGAWGISKQITNTIDKFPWEEE